MAITAAAGGAAGSAGAVGSLACSSFNTTNTGRIVVVVVLLDDTKSVSTVTDTAGASYSLISAYNVNATLRLEYWRCDTPLTKTGDVITATLASGTTSIAIAAEQYTGDVGVETGAPTTTGTSFYPTGSFTTTDENDFAVVLIGFNGASTDTITQTLGTKRQSAVGSSGAAGVALVDNTESIEGTLPGSVLLSVSRTWGTVSLGLQATTTVGAYNMWDGKKQYLFDTPQDNMPASNVNATPSATANSGSVA